MLVVGYVKDLIATFAFIIVALLLYRVKDLNKVKSFIIIGLIIGFFIDGLFTLNPTYHNENIGNNIPTYIVLIIGILYIFLFMYYKKQLGLTFL